MAGKLELPGEKIERLRAELDALEAELRFLEREDISSSRFGLLSESQ